jgi:HK97 family phage major capsid protein
MNFLLLAKELKTKLEAMLNKAKDEKRVFTPEENTQYDADQKQMENYLKMAEKEAGIKTVDASLATPVNTPEPRVDVGATRDKKWKNGLGEMLQAVVRATFNRGMDERLVKNAALGGNESVPSEGGFLVDPEHTPEIIKRTYETAAVASRCQRTSISSNRLTQNYLLETSRATGSRNGGVRGYWVNEADTITPSAPKLGQIEWKLKKLGAILYATEEMLADSAALSSIIAQAVPEEFAWLLDNAILNGLGGGEPLGTINSAAIVSVSKETGQKAATIVVENIRKMWARCWAPSRANAVWFINQDCENELFSMAQVVGAGGVPVYLPANGISGQPYSTLFGRPVIAIEQCATVGTTGDIVLADMSQYKIVDKPGIQTAESIHVQFLTDQRAFRFIYRVDGAPTWTSVLAPANGASNTLSPFVKLNVRA